jgi:predicted RND superfamily exporter protein
VLIGLGIDFAIHIVNRYYHQDMVSQDTVDRLNRTFQDAGMGIIVGGMTTAAAFYAVSVSDFRGFRELGILTGTGILFCMITMVWVLPSLLVCFSGKQAMSKPITIAGFGLGPILDVLRRYPKWMITIPFIAFIGLVVLGRGVRFDENLRNFRPADEKVFHLQDTVTRWIGGSTDEVLLVVQGPTEVDVLETTATIYSGLEELKSAGSPIVGIKSIAHYLPPPSQQMKNMAFIRQHPDRFNVNRIMRVFHQALEENGFQPSPVYHAYFTHLTAAFSAQEALLPSAIQENDLTRFVKMFFYKGEGSYKTITYISPAKDLWLRTDINALKTMISDKIAEKGVEPERYHFTGANFLTGELKALILKNLKSSTILAVLSIMVILFLFYRSVTFFILSVIPLVIGLGALLGILALFHLDFNFINLIVLPMIVGIGIDDGVHLTNTFRQTPPEDLREAMGRTGRAIVLTSLTTLVGFGSIILSHYPGLQSMGYVAVIGISACMVASLLFYPPLFEIIKEKGARDE